MPFIIINYSINMILKNCINFKYKIHRYLFPTLSWGLSLIVLCSSMRVGIGRNSLTRNRHLPSYMTRSIVLGAHIFTLCRCRVIQVNIPWICGKKYKGETSHTSKVRLKEYRKTLMMREKMEWSLADHIWREKGSHQTLWNEVKIIYKEGHCSFRDQTT